MFSVVQCTLRDRLSDAVLKVRCYDIAQIMLDMHFNRSSDIVDFTLVSSECQNLLSNSLGILVADKTDYTLGIFIL